MAAGRGRPMTLLPDLLIVFAVCRLAGEEEERMDKRKRRQLETQGQFMELGNRTADGGDGGGDKGEDGDEDGKGQRKWLEDAALDLATNGGSEGDPTEGATAPAALKFFSPTRDTTHPVAPPYSFSCQLVLQRTPPA